MTDKWQIQFHFHLLRHRWEIRKVRWSENGFNETVGSWDVPRTWIARANFEIDA